MDRYVLITPAYNEQENLPRLYSSVIAQTVPPLRWVIVDDGSSDGTGDLLDKYAKDCNFIKPLHLERNHAASYYAHKVHAFNKGYNLLQSAQVSYDFVGNLDADISLYPHYYQDILREFRVNKRLGVAGGSYRYSDPSFTVKWGGNYIPGSILLARRDCFIQTGGYRPLKYGGEDTLLCIYAEMHGWVVQYFPQYQVVQHRIVGSGQGITTIKAKFRQGLSEHNLGYHPLFALLKFARRSVLEKPYVLASLARYVGYLAGSLNTKREYVNSDAIDYLRRKQLNRLRRQQQG